MAILEVTGLGLSLGGRRILNDISMEFRKDRVHAIVGPNGAGKSTLASTIMGLGGYTDFDGDIVFEGESLKGLTVDERARRGITMAWQEPARFEGLKISDFIRAGARDKSDARCRAALEGVGLAPDKYFTRAVDRTLSGGERKRIELASILVMEPRLVLMDEPDSGIDVEALDRIFDAIRFLKGRGSTVILITHSMTVLRHAEHAFLICSGALLEEGPVDKIGEYFGSKCLPCDHKNAPAVGETPGETSGEGE